MEEGDEGEEQGMMAMSNAMADRDEDFNTRYGSYKGWQLAVQRVKATPRHFPAVDLRAMIEREGLRTPQAIVDAFLSRFISVPVDSAFRDKLIAQLVGELGTSDIDAAQSYLEEPLRRLLHLILSAPEYQLG